MKCTWLNDEQINRFGHLHASSAASRVWLRPCVLRMVWIVFLFTTETAFTPVSLPFTAWFDFSIYSSSHDFPTGISMTDINHDHRDIDKHKILSGKSTIFEVKWRRYGHTAVMREPLTERCQYSLEFKCRLLHNYEDVIHTHTHHEFGWAQRRNRYTYEHVISYLQYRGRSVYRYYKNTRALSTASGSGWGCQTGWATACPRGYRGSRILTPVLQHSWKFLRLFLMRKIFTPMYVHVCALFFIVQRVALCIIQIAS